MGDRTRISWATATWNPVTGCTKVSPGCDHCYAEALTERYQGKGSFAKVTLHPERLDLPLRWRKPRRIFVNSMSDLFHRDVPEEFIGAIWMTMRQAHWHTFLTLTKRPDRALHWFQTWGVAHFSFMQLSPLPNVWLGVSAENQRMADARLPVLARVPAAARFASLEPLLGPVDIKPHFFDCGCGQSPCICKGMALDWVIVGGESGPHRREMRIEWLESIVVQCRAAGVPVWVKQDSGSYPGRQGRIPDRLWVQELPQRKEAHDHAT